jgi:hypothetical protein
MAMLLLSCACEGETRRRRRTRWWHHGQAVEGEAGQKRIVSTALPETFTNGRK